MRKGKRKKGALHIIIPGLAVGLLFTLWWSNSGETSAFSNRELALRCTSHMAGTFHIHPRIEVVVEGERVPVPANIGVRPGCMSSLHTHDADGVIHVEAPEKRDFTLGDFFAVWGEPFGRDRVLDRVADADHRVRLTVNGRDADEYEDLVLGDKDRIVISYERVSEE